MTINKIVPRAYATNFNVPGMFGQFPKEYPDGQVKYLYLDWDKKVTNSCPAILPLRPFPGTIGSSAQGARALQHACRRANTPATWISATSSKGRRSMFPSFVPGALLWTGDSHAAQGNGEVNLTAIETAYKELNITVDVIKDMALDMPRIETPKSWITWASTRT